MIPCPRNSPAMPDVSRADAIVCPSCGTECSPTSVACPQCHQLLYADELRRLATEAAHATKAGDLAAAQAAWRETLQLLPPASKQYETITARLVDLSKRADLEGSAQVSGAS